MMSDERQVVIFKLGNEEYAIPIMQVQEIIRMIDITAVPQAPDFVEGIISLRGRIIPIIDLMKRFNLEGGEHSDEMRIIVVDVQNQTVGIIVDMVSEVSNLGEDDISPSPVTLSNTAYLSGVGKLDGRLIILLDLDYILTEKEIAAVSNINEKKA